MITGISVTVAAVCIVVGFLLSKGRGGSDMIAMVLFVIGGLGLVATPVGDVVRGASSWFIRWFSGLDYSWATPELAGAIPSILAVAAIFLTAWGILDADARGLRIVAAIALGSLLLNVDGPLAEIAHGILDFLSAGFATFLDFARSGFQSVKGASSRG